MHEARQSLVVGAWGGSFHILYSYSHRILEPTPSTLPQAMNSQNVKSWWSSSVVVKLWGWRKRMHWISFGLCKRCRLRSFCRKWRFQPQALETLAADFTTSTAWCCKFCFHLSLWGVGMMLWTAQRADQRPASAAQRERLRFFILRVYFRLFCCGTGF